MKVSSEQAGPCRRRMHVSVGGEDLAADYENVIAGYAAAARLPGFRKGRAPRELVERRFAKAIDEEVRDRAVPRLYRAALEAERITPVAIVGVTNVQFRRGSGASFDVTLDVAPEFDLPDYRHMALKAADATVTDEQVQERFERLIEHWSRFEDAEGRPVGRGDLVLIDYAGTSDGTPVAELAPDEPGLARGEDFWMLMSEPEPVPGLVEGLVGAAAGAARTVAVRFPADFRVAALAGRAADYEVTVKGLRQRVPPTLDAAFFEQIGMASEQEVRDRIRRDLEAAAAGRARSELRDQVAAFLLAKTEFDLPQTLVEQETTVLTRSLVRAIASQGATREQIIGQRDAIVGRAEQSSKERVRLSYILARIAQEENVGVSDEELDQRLREIAAQHGTEPERLRADLEKRNAIEGVQSDIRADKTLDLLIGMAKVK